MDNFRAKSGFFPLNYTRLAMFGATAAAVALSSCGDGKSYRAADSGSRESRHPASVLGASTGPTGDAAAVVKPRIVKDHIQFGTTRKHEMGHYAKRHYGTYQYRLGTPKVIVEHYTATTTYSSAWHTFSRDVADTELHELPGTCAHFIIDTDGTIYEVVPVWLMCRHTVGLNNVAIGIEHVGTSAAGILGNARQLRASLRLTSWLAQTYGIPLDDVIGHAESLTSAYHHERVSAWRCQTHSDWTYGEMQVYRHKVASFSKARNSVFRRHTADRIESAC